MCECCLSGCSTLPVQSLAWPSLQLAERCVSAELLSQRPFSVSPQRRRFSVG